MSAIRPGPPCGLSGAIVPGTADLTLAQLPDVLQNRDGVAGLPHARIQHGRPAMGMPPAENECTVRLSSVPGRVGTRPSARMIWAIAEHPHENTCLSIHAAYPVCNGGGRACPPEVAGGIGRFYDLVDALGDRTHEQDDELLVATKMPTHLRHRRSHPSRGWAPAQ